MYITLLCVTDHAARNLDWHYKLSSQKKIKWYKVNAFKDLKRSHPQCQVKRSTNTYILFILNAFNTQAHLLSFSFSLSLTLETHKAGECPQVCNDKRQRQTRPALQPFSMSLQPLSWRISPRICSCLPRSIFHFLSQRLSNDTGDNSDGPHIHIVLAFVFNSLTHLLKMHHNSSETLGISDSSIAYISYKYHIVAFIFWYCYIANMDTFEKVWRRKRELDSAHTESTTRTEFTSLLWLFALELTNTHNQKLPNCLFWWVFT